MENYMRFKIMGGHISMKPGAVPHKFDCQLNSVPDLCTSLKRGYRKLLIDDVGDDNAIGALNTPSASASAAASRLFEPTSFDLLRRVYFLYATLRHSQIYYTLFEMF